MGEGPASAIDQPSFFSDVLRGCTFECDGPDQPTRVLDATGRVIGIGATKVSACVLAERSRLAEMLPPSHYHPALEGCHFGIEDSGGRPMRTVLDASRVVLGVGVGKLDAAAQAVRTLLSRSRPMDLTMAEFGLICTAVTVEVVRGKSGRATQGEPYLRIDTRACDDSAGRLRAAVARELRHRGGGIAGLEARVQELLRAHVFDGLVHHVMLGNGECLVWRRFDAPSARLCFEHVYRLLWDAQRSREGERQGERVRAD